MTMVTLRYATNGILSCKVRVKCLKDGWDAGRGYRYLLGCSYCIVFYYIIKII